MASPAERIRAALADVYGIDVAERVWPRLEAQLSAFKEAHPAHSARPDAEAGLTEADLMLITYGDQILEPGSTPLRTLHTTLRRWIGDFLPDVHILPFFPYSSDDGFSVIDYRQVNPAWGDWDDIERLGQDFRLMFDAVINHISQESTWFRAFREGRAPYDQYFIAVDPETDLSAVVRPRTLPLLTAVETVDGERWVWTTFSADQIDLNYGSPDLLLEILDLLLLYASKGAQLIRLDAIGFMWKEIGTSCIHRPQAHRLIQLMRAVLDDAAPGVQLVTETNVPHAENISYFGDGYNEAQMVYNFTLPPLTLHTFLTGDASILAAWASGLKAPSPQTTFFNFMASHDGIGLRPLEGILPESAIARLAKQVEAHGGLVSYKANSDGSRSPYELNIVYYDALNDPAADEDQMVQVNRFLASQAILLSLAGVPGIYVHSLFGSRNWREGVEQTGQNRSINRRKFQRVQLEASLLDRTSVCSQVFRRYEQLIRTRSAESAFHPNGEQTVLDLNRALFAFVRRSPDAKSSVLCVVNVSDRVQPLTAPLADQGFSGDSEAIDLITNERFGLDADANLAMALHPYQIRWLKASPRK